EAADVVAHVAPGRARSIPVVAGADTPLQTVEAPQRSAGLTELMRIAREFSGSRRLLVLSTGAATDIASAHLEDPSIADRVAVVEMGFNDWPDGGREFNIKNDPRAWQVILDSRAPLVVGSGAATKRRLRLTSADAGKIMRPHHTTGKYLYGLFDR